MGWALFAASAFYVTYTLRQIYHFNRWLISSADLPPPEATRFWGEVYNRIYSMQRRQEKEKQRLEAVVNRVQDTTSALRRSEERTSELQSRGHVVCRLLLENKND